LRHCVGNASNLYRTAILTSPAPLFEVVEELLSLCFDTLPCLLPMCRKFLIVSRFLCRLEPSSLWPGLDAVESRLPRRNGLLQQHSKASVFHQAAQLTATQEYTPWLRLRANATCAEMLNKQNSYLASSIDTVPDMRAHSAASRCNARSKLKLNTRKCEAYEMVNAQLQGMHSSTLHQRCLQRAHSASFRKCMRLKIFCACDN
jgi:hypothetical protein